MTSLKAEGFDRLLAGVAEQARDCSLVEDAMKIALTLGGTIPESVGRAALTAAERVVLDAALEHGAALAPEGDGPDGRDVLVLARTGRLMVLSGGLPEGAHPIGSPAWPPSVPYREVAAGRDLAAREESARHEELRRWLSDQPADGVRARLDRIAYALVHMAPVLLHVGSRTYSNLGRLGNLPGRTIAAAAPESLLTTLADLPAGLWPPEDATFVACLNALLLSGPPVRAEEFNGVQLGPAALEEFLTGRIAAYGAASPPRGEEALGEWLERLATACARARVQAQESGAHFYRAINGVSLHKRELVLDPTPGHADVPPAVAGFLERSGPIPELLTAPAPPGFGSAYEGFLHEFLRTVARSLGADVAMARGPRDLRRLLGDPLALRTGDFYCCVVAGDSFADRFGGDRPALARALSAYSARMRFNTWHYLPHTLDVADRDRGRDDWFFAPAMPDITEWSDQHHTGHVTFGVRYAIRVPLGVTLGGAYRPGLYDLRLMRAQEPAFQLGHLRAAVAIGRLLAGLHQEMVPHDPDITDFANEWYRTFHA
ncbi:hypothetical protein [Streptosporangium sp. NPDC002607]